MTRLQTLVNVASVEEDKVPLIIRRRSRQEGPPLPSSEPHSPHPPTPDGGLPGSFQGVPDRGRLRQSGASLCAAQGMCLLTLASYLLVPSLLTRLVSFVLSSPSPPLAPEKREREEVGSAGRPLKRDRRSHSAEGRDNPRRSP